MQALAGPSLLLLKHTMLKNTMNSVTRLMKNPCYGEISKRYYPGQGYKAVKPKKKACQENGEPMPWHETHHIQVQDNETHKIIGNLTSDINHSNSEVLSNINYTGQTKPQGVVYYKTPIEYESGCVVEHKKATKFLQQPEIAKSLDAALDIRKTHTKFPRKRVLKSALKNKNCAEDNQS